MLLKTFRQSAFWSFIFCFLFNQFLWGQVNNSRENPSYLTLPYALKTTREGILVGKVLMSASAENIANTYTAFDDSTQSVYLRRYVDIIRKKTGLSVKVQIANDPLEGHIPIVDLNETGKQYMPIGKLPEHKLKLNLDATTHSALIQVHKAIRGSSEKLVETIQY